MLFATIKELELEGVFYKEASQLLFRNRLFARSLDFPKTSRQAAITFCKYSFKEKFLCLLVESKDYITVWIEVTEESFLKEEKSTEDSLEQFNLTDSSFKSEQESSQSLYQPLRDRNFANENSFIYHKYIENEEFYPIQFKNDITPDTLIPPQDISNQENHGNSSDSAAKKRPRRKYKGISY